MGDTLIITGDRNTHGKKDYTGAFKPEADRFARVVPGNHRRETIDVSLGMNGRKKQLYAKLSELKAKNELYNDVAFFMHGWAKGIQCGVQLADVKQLVNYLCQITANGADAEHILHIVLFCCLTGDVPGSPKADQQKLGPGGDGGFADRVRDEFCQAGRPWVKVYAHTTAGHTTRNPWVRTFEGKGSTIGAVDGDWLIRPAKAGRPSPLWGPWQQALWSKGKFASGSASMPKYMNRVPPYATNQGIQRKDLRFFAPFMTIEELHTELNR
jgi:hypothetical protein